VLREFDGIMVCLRSKEDEASEIGAMRLESRRNKSMNGPDTVSSTEIDTSSREKHQYTGGHMKELLMPMGM